MLPVESKYFNVIINDVKAVATRSQTSITKMQNSRSPIFPCLFDEVSKYIASYLQEMPDLSHLSMVNSQAHRVVDSVFLNKARKLGYLEIEKDNAKKHLKMVYQQIEEAYWQDVLSPEYIVYKHNMTTFTEIDSIKSLEKLQTLSGKDLIKIFHHKKIYTPELKELRKALLHYLNDPLLWSDIDKAHIDDADNSGYTSLQRAAENGCYQSLELFLKYGSKPDSLALIKAARFQNFLSVKVLLEQGADVNARNAQGQSALYWAIKNNDIDLLNLLLLYKADITDVYKNLPALHCAIKLGKIKVVEALLIKSDINALDSTGKVALYYAIISRDIKRVELLLKHNADVNLIDYQALQRIYFDFRFGWFEFKEIKDALTKQGAAIPYF